MDPFRLCVAFGPLAVYFLLLGLINLARRPLVVSGVRDLAVLGVALAGLILIGPVELFFPGSAAIVFGAYVWILLVALYALLVLLVVMLVRPRLVIYNITPDELRPILADVALRLDADARWAGDSLSLPNVGVQFHLEGQVAQRNVSLVASGPHQNHMGWRRLEQSLASALSDFEVPRNRWGFSLLIVAAAMILAQVLAIARDPQAIARALFDMLRL